MVPFFQEENLDHSIFKSTRVDSFLEWTYKRGEKRDKKEQVAGTNSLVGNEQRRRREKKEFLAVKKKEKEEEETHKGPVNKKEKGRGGGGKVLLRIG